MHSIAYIFFSMAGAFVGFGLSALVFGFGWFASLLGFYAGAVAGQVLTAWIISGGKK